MLGKKKKKTENDVQKFRGKNHFGFTCL